MSGENLSEMAPSVTTAFKAHIIPVPHRDQRYPTLGDWEHVDVPGADVPGASGEREGTYRVLEISVSKTGDWRYDALLAVHELIEGILCIARGITQAEVDAFDQAFERQRTQAVADAHAPNPSFAWPGGTQRDAHEKTAHEKTQWDAGAGKEPVPLDSEPGDHPHAPYRREHRDATMIEMTLAEWLGVDWDAYQARLDQIERQGSPPRAWGRRETNP